MIPNGSTAGANPPESGRGWCRDILPRVSRTFALSIKLLSRRLRHPVTVSYLMCRLADTIEDAAPPPGGPEQQARLLRRFAAHLDNEDSELLADLSAFVGESESADAHLARNADIVLREFRKLPAPDRNGITPPVQRMCEGMADYVERARGDDGVPSVIEDVADLERYCYFVAGTVGELLTSLFYREALDPARKTEVYEEAIKFGLGLQLTNVVADAPMDWLENRCFVPRSLVDEFGIDFDALFGDSHGTEGVALFRRIIVIARENLEAALRYLLRLPRWQFRTRLFCLVPLALAVKTLNAVEADPIFPRAGHRPKISRRDVYRTVWASVFAAPSNALTSRYFYRLSNS